MQGWINFITVEFKKKKSVSGLHDHVARLDCVYLSACLSTWEKVLDELVALIMDLVGQREVGTSIWQPSPQ